MFNSQFSSFMQLSIDIKQCVGSGVRPHLARSTSPTREDTEGKFRAVLDKGTITHREAEELAGRPQWYSGVVRLGSSNLHPITLCPYLPRAQAIHPTTTSEPGSTRPDLVVFKRCGHLTWYFFVEEVLIILANNPPNGSPRLSTRRKGPSTVQINPEQQSQSN